MLKKFKRRKAFSEQMLDSDNLRLVVAFGPKLASLKHWPKSCGTRPLARKLSPRLAMFFKDFPSFKFS